MSFDAFKMTMLEEMGYTDTSTGCINRVARFLAHSPNDSIDTAQFQDACRACNVDPGSFTQHDLDCLQKKLNEIT